MRKVNPENQLTTEELQQVIMIFDNGHLLSGLRKIMAEEADFWRQQGVGEALKSDVSTNLLVQYAARETQCKRFEQAICKAAGLAL